MRLTSALGRMARDFALFYGLASLRARLLGTRIAAAVPITANAIVLAVSIFAVLFVAATLAGEHQPRMDLISCDQAASLHTPARAKGARQQESEMQENPGPSRCGPWV